MDLIIQTNGKRFGETGDMESQAKWEQTLEDLADRGLIKDPNGLGKGFEVTQKGYENRRCPEDSRIVKPSRRNCPVSAPDVSCYDGESASPIEIAILVST